MSMVPDYPDVPEEDYDLRCGICGDGIEDDELYGVDWHGKAVCEACAREQMENVTAYELFRLLGYDAFVFQPVKGGVV